jgi:hypothetical protein
MDKTRHPHVIRTWRVERTKVLYRPPRPVKLPSDPVFQPFPTNRTGPHAAQRPAQSGELTATGSPPFVGFIARLRPNRFPGSDARKLSSPTNYLSGSFPHW